MLKRWLNRKSDRQDPKCEFESWANQEYCVVMLREKNLD